MSLFYDGVMGICWAMAYIAAIILGFKNRTWYFPALAICQNISWELLMVIRELQKGRYYGIPFIIQALWLVLDAGILFTWIIFDRHNAGTFIKKFVLLACVAVPMYIFAYIGGHWDVMSFLINAIMSGAFIWRKTKDKSSRTSPFIAITKLVGSLAATISYGLLARNTILLWLGGLCLLLDSYYLLMLYQKDHFGGWFYEKK